MKKKILFVINTMGQGGAETALLELLRRLDPEKYDISLLVLLGQGELIDRLPPWVRLLNKHYDKTSVLTAEGRKRLRRHMLKILFGRGALFRAFPYLLWQLVQMLRKGRVLADKLLWRVAAMGAPVIRAHFDLAVAYLEGGSAYYVADYVDADVRAGFIHIDYVCAGYTRSLDRDCYTGFQRVFCVSDEVRGVFQSVYPEVACEVFHNLISRDKIRALAGEPGGFRDGFQGVRILTVGRLNAQKALEVSIGAMRLLKEEKVRARWYVLGEGDERGHLEAYIREQGLEEDFLLPGTVSNPYPYFAQADLYVHATRYEGKSIAIQEAQTLGCAILVSDCSGNREQVEDGVDGLLCQFTETAVKEGILRLLRDEELRTRLKEGALHKRLEDEAEMKAEIDKLLSLMAVSH